MRGVDGRMEEMTLKREDKKRREIFFKKKNIFSHHQHQRSLMHLQY